MFPRRAYNDAIYEEYGSEADEECCRGRGFSAILCWFLSVFILIGLAASVVLTVFFILKSRSYLATTTKNNDNEFALGGFNIPPSVTTANDLGLDFTKKPKIGGEPAITSTTTRRFNKNHHNHPSSTSTTSTTTEKTTTDDSSLFNVLIDTIKNFNDGDHQRDGELGEPLHTEESHERRVTPDPDIEGQIRNGEVLFTMPPSTSSSSNSGSNSRRTFHLNNNGHGGIRRNPYSSSIEDMTSFKRQRGASKEENGDNDDDDDNESDVDFHFGESKLNKMLADQVPPNEGQSSSSTSTERPTTTSRTDELLERIIKTLQPKRNRSTTTQSSDGQTYSTSTTISSSTSSADDDEDTEKTTVGPTRTRTRYRSTTTNNPKSVVVIAPEKDDSSRSSNSNSDESLKIVPGPNLGKKKRKKNRNEQRERETTTEENEREMTSTTEFMDILVGADQNHQTLYTKNTEDGLITSAIVPPWYQDTAGNLSDILEVGRPSNRNLSFIPIENSEDAEYGGGTDLDVILNLFNQSPLPHRSMNRLEVSDSKASIKDLIKELTPKFPTTSSPYSSTLADLVHDEIKSGSNPYHYGYEGYYEDDGEDGEDIDHIDLDSHQEIDRVGQSADDNNHDINRSKNRENTKQTDPIAIVDMEGSPSELQLDIAIHDPKSNPEIVIDPDTDLQLELEEDNSDEERRTLIDNIDDTNNNHKTLLFDYDNFYNDPNDPIMNSESYLRPIAILPAPQTTHTSTAIITGGGIRHPMGTEDPIRRRLSSQSQENDLNVAANGPITLALNSSLPTATSASTTNSPRRSNEEFQIREPSSGVNEEILAGSGSSVERLERKPILSLDQTLYPNALTANINENDDVPAGGSDEIEEENHEKEKKVHQVFAVSYDPNSFAYQQQQQGQDENNSVYIRKIPTTTETTRLKTTEIPWLRRTTTTTATTTTTVRPKRVFVTSRPQFQFETTTSRYMPTTTTPTTISTTPSIGFVPPKPINFHENSFAMPALNYPVKDGWRPVVSNSFNGESLDQSQSQNQNLNSNQIRSPQQFYQQQLNYNTALQNSLNSYQLGSSSFSTTNRTPKTSLAPPHSTTTSSAFVASSLSPLQIQSQSSYESEEENSNEHWFSGPTHDQIKHTQSQQESLKPMRPSLQINSNNPSPPLQQQQQQQLHNSRVKFPLDENVAQQQQQQSYNNNGGGIQQHPTGIDRTKYTYRPAPPPIIMRRPTGLAGLSPFRSRKTAPIFQRMPIDQQKMQMQKQLLQLQMYQQQQMNLQNQNRPNINNNNRYRENPPPPNLQPPPNSHNNINRNLMQSQQSQQLGNILWPTNAQQNNNRRSG